MSQKRKADCRDRQKETSLWRTNVDAVDEKGKIVCNACGLWVSTVFDMTTRRYCAQSTPRESSMVFPEPKDVGPDHPQVIQALRVPIRTSFQL